MAAHNGYTSLFGGASNEFSIPHLASNSPDSTIAHNDGHSSSHAPSADPSSALSEDEVAPGSETDEQSNEFLDPPLMDRPNRFRGPLWKWKRFTEAERSLSASLDHIEDDDLSIHLYNAHFLKRRLYAIHDNDANDVTARQNPPQWQSKEDWISSGDEDGQKPWYPHRQWTSWPMEPQLVPRTDERLQLDWYGDAEEEKLTMRPKAERKPMPSHDLEDLLLTEVQRAARTRFDARPSAGRVTVRVRNQQIQSRHGYGRQAHHRVHSNMENVGNTDQQPVGSRDGRSSASFAPLPIRSRKRRRSQSKELDREKHKAVRLWHAGRAEALPPGPALHDVYLRPVILADDDEARELLQPTLRHLLSNFDNLLTALHHSRQNQDDEWDSDSSLDARSSQPSSSEQPRRRSKSGPRRGRRRDTDRWYRRESTSEYTKERVRKSLRARDWSQVLGVAAMTGWDEDVVQRAAARCSRLFGEDMEFAQLTVEELPAQREFVPVKVNDQNPNDELFGGVHVDGFLQPIRKRVVGRKREVGKNKSSAPQMQNMTPGSEEARDETEDTSSEESSNESSNNEAEG